MTLHLWSELALAGSFLFEQRMILSFKLSVDQHTPLRADFPLQFAWAAECVPEGPAGLPTDIPVRCQSASFRGVGGNTTHFTSRTLSRSTLSGGEYPGLSGWGSWWRLVLIQRGQPITPTIERTPRAYTWS